MLFLERTRLLHAPWQVRYDSGMAVIEIEERTAAALRAQADARDLSLEAFLRRIAEAATPINSMPTLPLAEFEKTVDELATESAVLPSSFSRADIYTGHD